MKWRKRLALNQGEAARRIRIHQSMLCLYEQGNCPGLDAAYFIECATDGEIPMETWVRKKWVA